MVEIRDVSADIPLSAEPRRRRYFVRKAYRPYLDLIIRELKDGRHYITVCGSPGSGKTFLYCYVVEELLRENPQSIVVTAAFAHSGVLRECVVFKPGDPPQFCSQIPRIKGSLHLYDGTPKVSPSNARMVCFMNLNVRWSKCMAREGFHKFLYFPTWELDELIVANEALGRPVEPEELSERYGKFGGNARACLDENSSSLRMSLDDLEVAILKIALHYNFSEISGSQMKSQAQNEAYEDIIHLVPSFPVPDSYTVNWASPYIAEEVQRNLEPNKRTGNRYHPETQTNRVTTSLVGVFE
jgi:hypothetical protein